jgi:hypothetical protein
MRIRAAWQRLSHQDWPRWAQLAGFLLGMEQVLGLWLAGAEPNIGVITFASALLMVSQRAHAAQQRRNEKRDGQ